MSKFDKGPDSFCVRSPMRDLIATNDTLHKFREYYYGNTISLGKYLMLKREHFKIEWLTDDAPERKFVKSGISKVLILGGQADNTWKDWQGLGHFNVLAPTNFGEALDFSTYRHEFYISTQVKRACVVYNATLRAFLLAIKGGWAAQKM